jgi:RecB family exonuclease
MGVSQALLCSFCERFIQNEVHWRESYPKTQTWAVEEPIRTHICRDGETIHFNQDEGIPFRGVIDRIDHNQKRGDGPD